MSKTHLVKKQVKKAENTVVVRIPNETHDKIKFLRKALMKTTAGSIIKDAIDQFFKERPGLIVDFKMFLRAYKSGTGNGGMPRHEQHGTSLSPRNKVRRQK